MLTPGVTDDGAAHSSLQGATLKGVADEATADDRGPTPIGEIASPDAGTRADRWLRRRTPSKPTEIPAKGWLQIGKRGWAEAKVDQVPLMGAGVAFYAFLALFPALIALVTLYGLFADPAVIADQVNRSRRCRLRSGN